MKFTRIIAIAGVAAASVVGLASQAGATVAVTDGVGTVDKTEVQAIGGGNNAAFQGYAEGVKFTTEYQMDSTDQWTCSDGSIGQRTSRVVQSRLLNSTQVRNTGNGQVTGFKLNGINENIGGTFVRGEYIGSLFQCPVGSYFTGFAPHLFINTVLPGTVQVTANGKTAALPNTIV